MKEELKKFLHSNTILFILYKTYTKLWSTCNGLKDLKYTYNYKYSKSLLNLTKIRNKYKGKRCFILGNGPSLNKTNLFLLKNEYTFGLNRIYLKFPDMGYKTNFHVSINDLVIDQCFDEYNQLSGIKKFYTATKMNRLHSNRNTFFLKSISPTFSEDITKGVWEGATVTYVAMQIAYYLGFKEVILVGVDHNFKTKGKPHSRVMQKGSDPNHFSPQYFKGMKWQLPDLKTSEIAYTLAKLHFQKSGRKIVDATINGRLNIFDKVVYQDLF
ncbi:DUF115 domain-containing protein [bacterium]|jgi:hypothetical protein|nr:DUF115 domain-containing protein [bacterium]